MNNLFLGDNKDYKPGCKYTKKNANEEEKDEKQKKYFVLSTRKCFDECFINKEGLLP